MAKLTTTYDTTLNKKVFVLNGEEAYARTTDTILTELNRETDWDTHIDYMLVGFEVDVLRDIGESSIVLYDNDEVLDVVPFELGASKVEWKKYYDETKSEWVDNRIKLAYGIEHNVYAKYMGNKQCLKSQSKTYSFFEELPNKFDSNISFVTSNTYFDEGTNITATIQLNGSQGYANQEINVYDNAIFVQTVTTNSNGRASVNIPSPSNGLHNVTVRFNGSDSLYACENSRNVSVGYLLKMSELPKYTIENVAYSLDIESVDYLGNPIKYVDFSVADTVWGELSQGARTDYDGKATIPPIYFSGNPFYIAQSGVRKSGIYTVPHLKNLSISMTPSGTKVSDTHFIYVDVYVENASMPVDLETNHWGTITTDETGNYRLIYEGEGIGDVTLTASIGNISQSLEIEDVCQYWRATDKTLNINYEVIYGKNNALKNGWKLSPSGKTFAMKLNWQHSTDDFLLIYNVVDSSGVTEIGILDGCFKTTLAKGDQIKIEKKSDMGYIYKNGNLLGHVEDLQNAPTIAYKGSSAKAYLTVDNLKFIRSV